MTVPNIFANATTSIPLSQLDQNFATPITLGNATVTLGGTLTSVGNLTLTNVTLTSLSAALVAAYGGTGLTSPGSSGNVLTSDGAGGWASIAPVLPGGFAWQSAKTSNFAGVTKCGYPVNTTGGAITATLPASPTAGDYMTFVDYARTFATNALTIDPNGGKINSVASTTVLNTNGASVSIVYVDATQGWLAYSGFSSSPIGAYSANYLAVAGGGGGGQGYDSTDNGGGGGAGGVLPGSYSFVPGVAYTITVGNGGASNNNGQDSSISAVATAIGGGRGASQRAANTAGNGGSGGGGAFSYLPGTGSAGQGYAGGTVNLPSGTYPGGGGGAGGVGSPGISGTKGGDGGIGTTSSISGASVYYGGGGGGGAGTPGAGGTGGGGAGSPTTGVAGTANTGGGGGGGGATPGSSWAGGAGGSGIVIIAYPGAQRGTGGTITTAGGYTIHTFTSSGTFNA